MTVVVTYVLMPFTLRVLGQDGYGTWLLISSVTGYLNLLMLGVPMASVRQFSMSLASGDERDLNVAVATCALDPATIAVVAVSDVLRCRR